MTKIVIEPLRVFIVEDDAIILMEIETLFEEAGHMIVGTAMIASEAIEKISKSKPELVFLDLRLKDGSSGLDVAQAIREENSANFVFLTANPATLTDDMEGAIGVIGKPFTETMIADAIAYLEECVRHPPPRSDLPSGLRLAPAYLARLDRMRAAH